MGAVKHMLRYMKGTLNLGCFYVRNKHRDPKLLGYNDSDIAGDVDNQKSATEVAFFQSDQLAITETEIGGSLILRG